jgi:hypothetical protein
MTILIALKLISYFALKKYGEKSKPDIANFHFAFSMFNSLLSENWQETIQLLIILMS